MKNLYMHKTIKILMLLFLTGVSCSSSSSSKIYHIYNDARDMLVEITLFNQNGVPIVSKKNQSKYKSYDEITFTNKEMIIAKYMRCTFYSEDGKKLPVNLNGMKGVTDGCDSLIRLFKTDKFIGYSLEPANMCFDDSSSKNSHFIKTAL